MKLPPPLQKEIDLTKTNVIGLEPDEPTELAIKAENAFVLRRAEKSDPLPDKAIANLTLNEVSVADALQLLLDGTGISLAVVGTNKGAAEVYGAVTIYGLSGNLPDIVEKLSKTIGFFYTYKDKSLTITQDQQFVVSLPPAVAEDTFAGMANTVTAIGGYGIYLDRVARTLMFRANRNGLDRIEQFLKHVRDNRTMIVYDTVIYQVDLNDRDQMGIEWSSLNASLLSGGAGAIAGGVQAAFSYTKRNFTQQMLLSFLSNYGTVKRISQPRLTVLMGSKGYFRQGQSTTYVSKIGNNFGTALNSVTVETASINTGIEMNVNGDVDGNTVYTRVNMKITDLLTLAAFTALGTQLSLPTTAEREISTEVRSVVGESILLGGILVNRMDDTVEGVPGPGRNIAIPTSTTKTGLKSELILAMTPRVIRFVASEPKANEESPATAPKKKPAVLSRESGVWIPAMRKEK